MTPIDGPAPLPRRLDQILAKARRSRGALHAPSPDAAGPTTHFDGDQLFAYWEGHLDPAARRDVEDHALGCEECWRWLLEVGKMFGV